MTHSTRFFIPIFALFALISTTTTPVAAAPPTKNTPQATAPMSEGRRQASQIDINSASVTDLRSLPGVGNARAKKIMAGRPYASVDDLMTRKVLPKSTYDKIRDRISAERRAAAAGGSQEKSTSSISKH